MKPTPKNLQVFLPEGTPAGIQIAAPKEHNWGLTQQLSPSETK